MSDRFVKPGEGRSVRVPAHGFKHLPAAGDFLADDVWLRRRLNEGDLVEAEAPKAAEPEPVKPAAKADKAS